MAEFEPCETRVPRGRPGEAQAARAMLASLLEIDSAPETGRDPPMRLNLAHPRNRRTGQRIKTNSPE